MLGVADVLTLFISPSHAFVICSCCGLAVTLASDLLLFSGRFEVGAAGKLSILSDNSSIHGNPVRPIFSQADRCC